MKTMRKMITLLAVAGLVFALAPAASAAQLYYESFTESAYPTAFLGSTPDSGGGVWTSAQGASADQIVAGSIDTTGLVGAFDPGRLEGGGLDRRRA